METMVKKIHKQPENLWSRAKLPYSPYHPSHQKQEITKKEQFMCYTCWRYYKPEKHYQMYCSDECESSGEEKMNRLREELLNSFCYKCGLPVRKKHENRSMSVCEACKHQNAYLHSQKNREQKRLENAHNSKNKRKDITYSELIRRSEYKRVFKDSGWSHYLKGRKWDRI